MWQRGIAIGQDGIKHQEDGIHSGGGGINDDGDAYSTSLPGSVSVMRMVSMRLSGGLRSTRRWILRSARASFCWGVQLRSSSEEQVTSIRRVFILQS